MGNPATRPQPGPNWEHMLSGQQLSRLGVRLLNRFDLELECRVCGERWMSKRLPNGRLAPGYWKCPNRCNW